MSILSNFENRVEGAVDGAAAAMFSSPIEPAQIAKKAEKQMKKEKLVGSGRQYAPTLYNVLVNERDDKRLFGFYPTMASEIENYLLAKGTEAGMEFDTRPLVRFIPDPGLKKGRFDVIAEVVASPIIKKLRAEEIEYYGLEPKGPVAEAKAPVQSPAVSPVYQRVESGYPSQPASGKFAGLGVPAHIEDVPDSSALPPLSLGRSALDAQPGNGVGIPIPAMRPAAPRGYSLNGYEQEESAVIGQAMLYNLSEQRSHHLEHRKLTVGRGKDNDIVIADANASRVHARFSQDATGRWKITDLDSTNGTLMNGRPVSSAILKSGDEITIGTTVLQFTE